MGEFKGRGGCSTLLLDFQGLGDPLGLGEEGCLLHPHFLGTLALGWGGGLGCAQPQARGPGASGEAGQAATPLLR